MGTTNILDLNNRVDELEKSYPANKVVMTGGKNVEDTLDELTANGQGTRVELTSYTESNPYTAPSDGYLIIYLHPGSSGYGCIESTLCAIGGDYYDTDSTHNARYGIYVRKGMHLFCTGAPHYAAFIPIS